MIMSRYLPEPAPLTPHSPGSARDDSPTRFYLSSRLGDSGRRPFAAARRFGRRRQPGLGEARPPFDRLKFYSVSHQLVHRLKPYEVTDLPLMFRNATWGTLVYWQQLFDDPDPQPVNQGWLDRLRSISSGLEMTEDEAREFYGAEA